MTPDLQDLITALSRPDFYPEKTSGITFIQTQMSCVFLTDEYAYKIKKPVNLGYVDYTTIEKRLHFCEREIELNRRLCPGAYLGVIPITFSGGNFILDGSGDAVEYAVKMKRLPESRLLDNLLGMNAATPEMIGAVAGKVADFHAGAETNERIAAFGGLSTINQNSEENFGQTEKYIGRSISEKQFSQMRDYTRTFIHEHAGTFEARAKEGRIRDCHGDLHAAHICFCQELCIFDCIEFNERFRFCDVASEAAFLAMDLDHFGRADLGRRFIEEYIERSSDQGVKGILNFYKCYRAWIRGKVACFKSDDPLVSAADRQESVQNAQGYFDLATSYTRKRPILVVMAGLVGSGKTTMANALSRHLGAVHISSDVTRKRLAGIPQTDHRFDEPSEGIYSAEFNTKTYDAIFEEARANLKYGYPVILDAAFLKRTERNRAVTMATKLEADALVVECRLSPELTQERLLKRLKEVSASDGRWEIYEKQTDWFEPVDEMPDKSHLLIDTSKPLLQNVRQVLDWIG